MTHALAFAAGFMACLVSLCVGFILCGARSIRRRY